MSAMELEPMVANRPHVCSQSTAKTAVEIACHLLLAAHAVCLEMAALQRLTCCKPRQQLQTMLAVQHWSLSSAADHKLGLE